MKILITYYSKYGSTHKCVEYLSDRIVSEVKIQNLADTPDPVGPTEFDLIIFGAPVYAGNFHRLLRNYFKKWIDVLTTKKIALFILCWEEGKAIEYIHTLFPPGLAENTTCMNYFGYEVTISKLHEFERIFFEKEVGLSNDTSKIRYQEMDQFIETINSFS